jgi:magnesium transporter
MQVHLITDSGVSTVPVADLADLLASPEGIVWVDVPTWDEQAEHVLRDVVGLHPIALQDCARRNRLPKVHAYPDGVFLVLQAPERGEQGHVHLVELDRFIGQRLLVTVHGPLSAAVPLDVALRDTEAVLARARAGRFRPTNAFDLSHAIVSTMTRRTEQLLETLAAEVWQLDRRVTSGELGDPEQFLDELFRARHGLLGVSTAAEQSGEIYRRLVTLSRYIPERNRPLAHDLVDQFDRIRGLAATEKDYLQGVIDMYRTRTDMKMTIAAERLAVIAVVTLPVTALASVLGMNLIVNDATTPGPLVLAILVMLTMCGLLLGWAKRRGWW